MPSHKLSHPQTAALLSEAGWLRSLALSLVRDAELADDLAQQTWVQALQHPPEPDRSLRAWLRVVMKNLLHQQHRSNARRADREQLAASAPLEPEVQGADLLARVGMQQKLVESVMQMEEPYRSTILLRFFEELSPRAIASRENVPVSTVKTRLARGLDRLRQRLDDSHGQDRRSWIMALLPVLKTPAGQNVPLPLALQLGSLVVNTKAIVALFTVLLGAGYFVSRQAQENLEQPLGAASPQVQTEAPRTHVQREPELEGEIALESTDRREVEVGEAVREPAAEAPLPVEPSIRGRVVDLQGRPVSDVTIVAGPRNNQAQSAPEEVLGTSEADGRFELPSSVSGAMQVRSEHYTTVMEGVAASEGSGKETVLVVAAKIQIGGQVRDDAGVAIGNASVRLTPSEQLRANIPFILDYSREIDFIVHTDEAGHFEFSEAPVFLAGQLMAAAKGYASATQPAPATDHSNRVFVLAQPLKENCTVAGVVLDMRGQRVADALVGLGVETATSDEQGRFAFYLDAPDSIGKGVAPFLGAVKADRLLAMKAGHQTAELVPTRFDEAGRPVWPEHVILRLGEEPLSIRGRVVDEAGEGLADMRVWITDGTFLGAQRVEGRRFPEFLSVESSLAGLDSSWPYVETNATGDFELNALMDRTYSLVAMDPATLVRTSAEAIQAGSTGVRLALSYEETWDVIRGRVQDRRGNPIPGAQVRVSCDAYQRKVLGQVVGTSHGSGARTLTDENGRFEFGLIPMEFAYFRVDHNDAIPVEVGRSEQSLRDHVGNNPEELILTIELRCHFRLELASPEEADQFEVRTAEDVPLTLSEFHAGGRRDGPRFAIEEGRTNFVAVGDSATTLVLFREDEEVRRVPIQLTPGEKPTLRP